MVEAAAAANTGGNETAIAEYMAAECAVQWALYPAGMLFGLSRAALTRVVASGASVRDGLDALLPLCVIVCACALLFCRVLDALTQRGYHTLLAMVRMQIASRLSPRR